MSKRKSIWVPDKMHQQIDWQVAPYHPQRPSRMFYERSVPYVARDMLGMTLVCRGAACVLTETEAYHESEPAAHSFSGLSERTRHLFGPVGHAYVYLIYGIHHMLNISAEKDQVGAGVLIRSAVPVGGLDLIIKRRQSEQGLCTGPARIVQALAVKKEDGGLCTIREDLQQRVDKGGLLELEKICQELPDLPPTLIYCKEAAKECGLDKMQILCGSRIGISHAKDLLWRFGADDKKILSRPFEAEAKVAGVLSF